MNVNEILPIEMIREIFSYLSIRDNLRCRSVCKLWCSVSKSLKYSKLSIVRQNPPKPNSVPIKKAVYEPTKSINLIKLANDNCISGLLKEATFRNVREMSSFFSNVNLIYHQNFYNNFPSLETLTIGSNENIFDTGNPIITYRIILNLKFLKKLTVNNDYFHFKLDTPELLHLECVVFPFPFRFECKDKIKFLKVNDIQGYLAKNILLKLEILVILRRTGNIFEQERFFNQLINLKEIHLSQPGDSLIPLLERFGQFRKENNRQHFEIFVLGLHFEFYQKVIRMNEDGVRMKEWLEEHTDFLIRNLRMIPEKAFGDFGINYNHLEPLSVVERENFLNRFEDIRSVSVNKTENEKLLLEFLRKTRPDRLALKCFQLYSKDFLTQLSQSCQFLRELSLEASESFESKKINFLFKLKNLVCLQIRLRENPSYTQFIEYALKYIPSLKDVRIHSLSRRIEVFSDWRVHTVKIHQEIAGILKTEAITLESRTKCIHFFRELAEYERDHNKLALANESPF